MAIIPPNYGIELPASDFADKREIARSLAQWLIAKVPPPLLQNRRDSNRQWTTNVRKELRSIITTEEFSTLQWQCMPNNPDKPESSAGEFLVDFVWWRAREGAVLVVESEWSEQDYEILKDFDKIAVIKAPFKLMLYSPWTKRVNSEYVKSKFEDYLQNYVQHIQGETYIFVEFMANERAQAFVWQALTSGRNDPAKLEELIPVMSIQRPKENDTAD